jgi:hypothetical protein
LPADSLIWEDALSKSLIQLEGEASQQTLVKLPSRGTTVLDKRPTEFSV